MDFSKKSGAFLAASAAALLLSGAVVAPASAGMKSKVKCYGVNACKGQAACKGAKNACAGHNKCKGKGFIVTSSAKCHKIGGKVK